MFRSRSILGGLLALLHILHVKTVQIILNFSLCTCVGNVYSFVFPCTWVHITVRVHVQAHMCVCMNVCVCVVCKSEADSRCLSQSFPTLSIKTEALEPRAVITHTPWIMPVLGTWTVAHTYKPALLSLSSPPTPPALDVTTFNFWWEFALSMARKFILRGYEKQVLFAPLPNLGILLSIFPMFGGWESPLQPLSWCFYW